MRHASIPRIGVKRELVFHTDTTGWITSRNTRTGTPVIQVTTDGGKGWNLQKLANASAPNGSVSVSPPSFLTRSTGYLSVEVGGPTLKTTKTLIFTTRNDGHSWSPVGSVPGMDRVVFMSPSTGFATTGRKSAVTTDGGNLWRKVTAKGLSGQVFQIEFLSPEQGWALVAPSGDGRVALLSTDNGGMSWSPT